MESGLARVPESAIMTPDEEAEYIKCNSVIFQDGHPLVKNFSDLCPNFLGGQSIRILDVGCGMANMAVQFAMAFPEAHVVAVDASVAMLRYAKVFVEHFKLGNRVSVRCAWLPDADFGEPDRSFDLVFARSTFHHFADPMDFWRVVKRYAKDDAAMFVIDLLRPPTLAKLNEFVWQRFGEHTCFLKGAFQASLLASHTIDEMGLQLLDAGLGDVTLALLSGGTHAVAWRPGRFGRGTR